jgi:probable HAF family extracellular repeat protein
MLTVTVTAMEVVLSVSAYAQLSIVDLGTLGGAGARAFWINDPAQVVGDSDTGTGQTHAFLWQHGVMTDLGTLPGGTFSSTFTNGKMINNRGQVAANCDLPGAFHACLWQRGVMTDIGTLGGPFSSAGAINDRGQSVGFSTNASGVPHRAVLWTSE